jgi:hypothetical protein
VAFFSKTDVMLHFTQNSAVFLSQKAPIFSAKIFDDDNIGPQVGKRFDELCDQSRTFPERSRRTLAAKISP